MCDKKLAAIGTWASVRHCQNTFLIQTQRNFVFKFAELLSDRLDRNLVTRAMSGHASDYGL